MEDKPENSVELNPATEFNSPDGSVNPLMLIPIFLLSFGFDSSCNNQDMSMQEIFKKIEEKAHVFQEAIAAKEKELASLNSEQK